MTDNGQTPLLMVDATQPGVTVPADFVEDGHIVLNVSWSATRNLQMDNSLISFEARFGGKPHAITLPTTAIKGIYARESGRGMMFQNEAVDTAAPVADAEDGTTAVKPAGDGKKPRPPGLRLVK